MSLIGHKFALKTKVNKRDIPILSLLTAGNLHKWMYTCRSCAILCVQLENQRKIEPLVTAWNYPSGVSGDWQAPFFMLGTRNWSTQLSVLDAIAFYEQNGGLVWPHAQNGLSSVLVLSIAV